MTEEMSAQSVVYPCHHCGMKLDLTTEFYGVKVQCPGCENKFVVQDPAEVSPDDGNNAAAQQAAAEQAAQEAAAQRAAAEKEAAAQQAAAQQATEQAAAQQVVAQKAAAKKAAAQEAAMRKAARAAASDLEPVVDEMRTDVMMRDFKGQKVLFLVLAAVVVHVVILVGSSFGYLKSELFGTDTTELTKEERVDVALGEATSALSEIVERHNLKLDDVLEKFAAVDSSSRSGASASNPPPSTSVEPEPAPDPPKPEREKTEFEKNLIKPEQGPTIPVSDEGDELGL